MINILFRLISFISLVSTMASFAINPSALKIGLCQILVGANKLANIKHAEESIRSAIEKSSQLVVLPECWNSPYGVNHFPVFAEPVPNIGELANPETSPSIAMLQSVSKSTKTWIIGGSVPEREGDKLYNTCVVLNSEGEIVGKHRKIHLFDIDVPGKITFKESDSLSPGNTPTLVQTPWGVIGVGICYDIRFPEYAMLLRSKGAKILVYPGAFNMVTGPAHWELLQRARAVDNQVYVAACSPARDTTSGGYVAWGHSTVVAPWGDIIVKAEAGDEIVTADLDLSKVEEMRDSIPCWKQKRDDIYTVQFK